METSQKTIIENQNIKIGKYTTIHIGYGSNEEHPIEKAIREANEFIYIISPYISKETIDSLLLKTKNNPNIDIKIICSYNNTSRTELEKLRKFLRYSKDQNLKMFKETIDKKYSNNEKKINFFIKLLYFLLALNISIFSLLFYLKKLSQNIFIFLGIILILQVFFLVIFHDEKGAISHGKNKEIFFFKKKYPPIMEWNKRIKAIITKNKYNDKEAKDKNIPIIHTKLYVMDCPALTEKLGKTEFKAFFGSANFTNSALHKNHEIYCDTTDFNVTDKLKEYFEELYNLHISNNFEEFPILEIDELSKELYKYDLIKHLKY